MVRPLGKNWLLNIAIDEYQDKDISNLNNPIRDASNLEEVLKNHYRFFEDNIIRCFNRDASRENIWRAFDKL
ncbi:MAG: sulfatase-modifying factor protein, partial [Bacteroidota bacterium]